MKRWSWLSLVAALFAVAVAIRQRNGDIGIAQFKGFAAHPSLFAIIDRSRAALVKAGLVRGYDACSCGVSFIIIFHTDTCNMHVPYENLSFIWLINLYFFHLRMSSTHCQQELHANLKAA
jgi:hypothetical protein